MVERLLDDVFHALAHPARRDMVSRLACSELTVTQLAEPFAMSLAASSKHVVVLERAGLVRRRVVGRQHRCRLLTPPLSEARAWVLSTEQYWTEHLDALADALADPLAGTDESGHV